jgi:hypothetical protein
MGLDLTILPHKHHHVSGTPLLAESLRLDRDYALFDRVLAVPREAAPVVTTHSDDGWRDTWADAYGAPLRLAYPRDLAAAFTGDLSPWNAAVGAFLAALPPDVPVYLYWH